MSYNEQQFTVEHVIENKPGMYTLIRDIDRNVREFRDEFYDFRREMTRRAANIEEAQEKQEQEIINLKIDVGMNHKELAAIKSDIKELRDDMTELKGDMKSIKSGFEVTQTRFNWGLVILGIIVALIQILK